MTGVFGSQTNTGYMHPLYAESLREFGTPRKLRNCSGWIIERQIPGTTAFDAMGVYPLFCCQDWTSLEDDIAELKDRLVSISLVTDPFGSYTKEMLEQMFDVVLPFKDHYVADTSKPLNETVSSSHRRIARRALREVDVLVCDDPSEFLDEWVKLYSGLAERHRIGGLRAFSREGFATQLRVPGSVMFRALHKNQIVGLDLWYIQGDVAQGHLVAFNEDGYKFRASYATKWTLSEYFADKVRWINFGGTPGSIDPKPGGGLAHFKTGWSNGIRKTYFCGRILHAELYRQLAPVDKATSYFPSYREGEFE